MYKSLNPAESFNSFLFQTILGGTVTFNNSNMIVQAYQKLGGRAGPKPS